MVDHKLSNWLKLRREIDSTGELAIALNKVADYWHNPPFTPYYLSSDSTEWPDPWTLVRDDVFCDVAKALAMLYTIYFSKYKDHINLEIRVFKCLKTGYEYNTVWINDGEHILNCDRTVISKEQLPDEFKLIKRYSLNEIGVDKY